MHVFLVHDLFLCSVFVRKLSFGTHSQLHEHAPHIHYVAHH